MSNMNLCGVAYIRAINSPENFKRLAEESKELFHTPEGKRYVVELFSRSNPNMPAPKPPPEFNQATEHFMKKAMIELGRLTFMDCKLDFDLKENQSIIHDIVTEVTIKDGIVTKIEKPNLKYAYGIDN